MIDTMFQITQLQKTNDIKIETHAQWLTVSKERSFTTESQRSTVYCTSSCNTFNPFPTVAICHML